MLASKNFKADRPRSVSANRSAFSKFNAAKRNQGRCTFNVDRDGRVNAVKPSAVWIRKDSKPNGASTMFQRYNYIDARGRSKSIMAWIPKSN